MRSRFWLFGKLVPPAGRETRFVRRRVPRCETLRWTGRRGSVSVAGEVAVSWAFLCSDSSRRERGDRGRIATDGRWASCSPTRDSTRYVGHSAAARSRRHVAFRTRACNVQQVSVFPRSLVSRARSTLTGVAKLSGDVIQMELYSPKVVCRMERLFRLIPRVSGDLAQALKQPRRRRRRRRRIEDIVRHQNSLVHDGDGRSAQLRTGRGRLRAALSEGTTI